MKTYCIGGPFHAPHVLAQNRLLEGQHVDIGVELNSGQYVIAGPQLSHNANIEVENDAVASRAEYVIGDDLQTDLPTVCSGDVCVKVKNKSKHEVLVRLEQKAQGTNALTAGVASQHPLFRKLFPAEVTSAEHLVGLSNVYLLAIRHANADEMLDQVGDIQVRENWNQLQRLLTNHDGCQIVECTHESLIASFDTIDDLLASFQQITVGGPTETGVSINECGFTIQTGEVMTGVSANQPSTFGKTVRLTKKTMLGLATGELRLPRHVFDLVQKSKVWTGSDSDSQASGLMKRFSESVDSAESTVQLFLHRPGH